MAPSRKLVIGIDFGTTFSGVAWLFYNGTKAPDAPQVVTRWLSTHARNSDRVKVPTKIHYDSHTAKISWGYNIPEGEPIQWFKLLLLNDEDLPVHLRDAPHIQKARAMLNKLQKDATQVTADYLKQLWQHTLKAIEKDKGQSIVKASSIHVVLTIPAIYKDYGRERMKRAAELAGILDKRPPCDDTTLSFVTEPESAVIATLPELDYRQDLRTDDSFVVCDCGGGTVDIISYAVTQADPLVIRECVEGDGALCGGTFLDQDFVRFMKRRFPGGTKAWDKTDPTTISKFLNSEWEHGIKPDFDGTDRTWTLDLPKRGKRGQLEVTAREINDVFDNVITGIKKLVVNQVKTIKTKTSKHPKASLSSAIGFVTLPLDFLLIPSQFIVLTGGFGRCPFIYASLTERYQGVTEILQSDGERPWSSICRGAAIYGAQIHGLKNAEIRVRSRVSRLSYGWTFSELFVAGVHHIDDKIFDDIKGYDQATNQMEWAIKRGHDVETDHATSFNYEMVYRLSETTYKKHSVKIYSSTSSSPASRLGSGADFPLVANLKWELPVPARDLPIVRRFNREYRLFMIEFQMEVSGASLDLRVVAGGKVLGSTSFQVKTD